METLPVLPLEQILTHLEVRDLLACSLVSIGWRAAVNNDHVWKQICHCQSSNATIDHVQAVQSSIPPTFLDPEPSNKELEPLCYWRIVYMKLQHVKRNWQRANHKTYKVTDLAYNYFDLKVHKDVLIANVNDNHCAVWNIRGIPVRQETIVCALTNTRCKCMIHVCDNKLAIVQDTLLQVYTREGKHFKLSHRRLFNQAESVSETIPKSQNIDEWYNEAVKRRPTHLQAFYVGKYFIGLAENGPYDGASFHVWDTETGGKLKEEQVKAISSEIRDPIYNVKFCPPKSDLGKILVCVQHTKRTDHFTDDSYYTVLYIYDLSTLTFKKLNILRPHVPWIYYENHIILTVDHTQAKLSIYNSSNGESLVSKQYEEIINPDSVQVHGNHLGFKTGGDLVVLNVKDFDLVFTTAIVKFSSNLFGFDFTFLDWNLVLIARWDKVNKIEVWSMDKKTLLSTLGTTGLMFPCNNSAKFFVWNEMVTTIYMLQFW
uniref:F-box domain-containing protein n=1 Tax=Cuerna arida TaxID=1464854 RepID=A0A1B6F5N9_9HEMI